MENGDNKKQVAEIQATDMNPSHLERIERFIEAGRPNIHAVDETVMYRMLDLYLGGKTYSQISSMTGLKKDLILYLSNKMNWYNTKKDYEKELYEFMDARLISTKLQALDFTQDIILFFQKRLGKKINRFLALGDETSANAIDVKDIDKYLKTVDMLYKLTEANKGAGASPVGLNVGDGVTIKKTGEGTLEITPKKQAISDVLKHFAEMKREEAKATQESMKPKNTNNNGEEDESKE